MILPILGKSLPHQWEWINCGPVSKGPRVLKVGGGGDLARGSTPQTDLQIGVLGGEGERVNGWWNYSWQGCW